MDEELVREYREAYKAANPQNPEPKIRYNRGWYYISFGYAVQNPYRRAKLVEMRDTLKARVEGKK